MGYLYVYIFLFQFITILFLFLILSKTAWLKIIYKMTYQTYDFIFKKCQCLVGNDQYRQLTVILCEKWHQKIMLMSH